jgi:hypothetical protein
MVVPVPVRLTVCGLPGALSVTVTAADRAPVAVGEKTTTMLQAAPAASELPHVLVCVKSWTLTPVMAMAEIVNANLPVL